MQVPTRWSEADYERAYQELRQRWTMEDDMEATPQTTQRDIFGTGFCLVRERRADFHAFAELAVIYPTAEGLKSMCPDGMVVLGFLPECDRTSFRVGFEPSGPFWVLEYVSDSTENKDYKENFERYGRELAVPYCLLFDPRDRARTVLALYRHDGETGYVPVEPNVRGRLEIPELDLEVALDGRWARLWHRGELLELPEELERRLADRERELAQARQDLSQAKAQGAALLGILRGLVETKARAAGRNDILAALPTADDPEQLQRWLAELG